MSPARSNSRARRVRLQVEHRRGGRSNDEGERAVEARVSLSPACWTEQDFSPLPILVESSG